MIEFVENEASIDNWNDALTRLKKNPFIAVVDIPCSNPTIKHALNILRSAFSEPKQAQVLHVHLVGDGKAGKSVAAQWLIHLFERAKRGVQYEIDTSSGPIYTHTDVQHGRTRGMQTTTLRFQDDKQKNYVFMIHDYGGQEEFLSNHANFLATDNSVYLIVVPLLKIGSSIDQRRVRSITEMLERYLFWCRFVFSVVRRDVAFPSIGAPSDNRAHDINLHHSTKRGIPMITLVNSFKQFCWDSHYRSHLDNAIAVLERQLRNEFTLSTNVSDSNCDFVTPQQIFHVTDNACDADMMNVIKVIDEMLDGTPVNGEHRRATILDHVMNRFEGADLPIFMTEDQWKQWMRNQIISFQFNPPFTIDGLLTTEQQEDVIMLLFDYCQDNVISMDKIMMLQEAVNGYKVVTNPSILSSEILGDLLWWFHKYNKNKMDIESLRLSQDSIIEKLNVVAEERRQANDQQISTFNYGFESHGGLHSLPLVELLNKIGLGLQIYDEQKHETQSWLLGLAPDFPKGKRELRFDWWPDHEIRRYFRLPDTRACFIPGYFLRLFVNMINNKGYKLVEGYGNAAKMSKSFRYPPGIARCDVQIILCQLSDKDQDAFIVSVAAFGAQAMQHAFRELNVLRSFIYSDSWGLNFQEFCLPLWHSDDQTDLSRIREDLLQDKQALDEIMPYIFGVPQCVESYYHEASSDKDDPHHHHMATLLLEDCFVVRHEWSKIFFGYKPVAKTLNQHFSTKDGNELLRKQFQYRPSEFDLRAGKYMNSWMRQHIHEQYGDMSASDHKWMHDLPICNEDLHLEISDIFQRYAEACYEIPTMHEIIEQYDPANIISELHVKETLARAFKSDASHPHHDTTSLVQVLLSFMTEGKESLSSLHEFDDIYEQFIANLHQIFDGDAENEFNTTVHSSSSEHPTEIRENIAEKTVHEAQSPHHRSSNHGGRHGRSPSKHGQHKKHSSNVSPASAIHATTNLSPSTHVSQSNASPNKRGFYHKRGSFSATSSTLANHHELDQSASTPTLASKASSH